MKFDIVFLDVGGIVLEIEWQLTTQALGIHDVEAQNRIWNKVGKWDVFHSFERGHITPEQFFDQFRKEMDFQKQIDLEHAWNQLIKGELPKADEIFKLLKGKIPVVALSNTNLSHRKYFDVEFPVMKNFDQILTSYELGHRKPDLEIYVAAAEKMNVQPERCLFIDDSLANVEAARRVGFTAHQTINSPQETIQFLKEKLGL